LLYTMFGASATRAEKGAIDPDAIYIDPDDSIRYIEHALKTGSDQTAPGVGMENLNDLFIFSQVVDNNGFTGAARALGVARSSICRRVGQLESQLGVRLVQRSTRHFAVTALGIELHSHCLKMIAEAKAVYDRAACAKARPSGLIRVSCPAIVAQLMIAPLMPAFVEQNPEVRLAIEATNRKIDIDENFDISIRVRQVPSEDSGMIMRSLGIVQQVLVASPGFIALHGTPSTPAAAAMLPTLSYGSLQGPHVWKLVDGEGQEIQIRHEPKFVGDDMALVRQTALAGIGIAQLPLSVCIDEIRAGRLEIVLPEYPAPLLEIQLVFPSRRGMLPGVRSFIDFLSKHCVSEVAIGQIKRTVSRGHRDTGNVWTNRLPPDVRSVELPKRPASDLVARVA
jgi:DNA-binding transcriptional LysR family regulator